jgi:hypothetical protein
MRKSQPVVTMFTFLEELAGVFFPQELLIAGLINPEY